MDVAFVATKSQYIDHLSPIWRALDGEERAGFYTSPKTWPYAQLRGLQAGPRSGEADTWMSCAPTDLRTGLNAKLTGRRVFTDHGVGLQWYTHSARILLGRNVDLILPPNEYVAELYRQAFPRKPIEVIGTPKMDRLLALPRRSDGRTVALSLHWTGINRGAVSPLLRFEAAFRKLAERDDITVLGHGHPHVMMLLAEWYAPMGIEPVVDFEEVVERADVYVCDHSSTIYEWAALGRPVVLLDWEGQQSMPQFSSGLRYQDWGDIGLHATEDTLDAAVDSVLADDAYRDRREEATSVLYPWLGASAQRAVEVLRG